MFKKSRLRQNNNNKKKWSSYIKKKLVCKIKQSTGFLGGLLDKIAGQLMEAVVVFDKYVLFRLGLRAAAHLLTTFKILKCY